MAAPNIQKYTKYEECHTNQHKTLIISNLKLLIHMDFVFFYSFEIFVLGGNVLLCFWCVFVLRIVIFNAFIGLGDIFCIYENIL